MNRRRLVLLGIGVISSSLMTIRPSLATDVDKLAYETQATADAVYNPFVPTVPDVTGRVDFSTVMHLLGPADPGEGGSKYSQKYCGKYQWNNGTEAGDSSGDPQPCVGDSGADYLVGTGTRDNSSASAEGGWMDILVGGGGNDFLTGGQSPDVLWGDFVNGDTADDGDDILDGGDGADYLYGGRGQDELFGGKGADHFMAHDGERDVIHCADSAADAGRDAGVQSYDYVEYDRGIDVLDDSCGEADKRAY